MIRWTTPVSRKRITYQTERVGTTKLGKVIVYMLMWLSYCRSTSIYQPTNAHIISHKTLLKTLRHVSILSDHHQGALFLAKVILRYSQFNSYLQTRCCGSISCCVGMCCGAVARCASYDAHLATAPNLTVRNAARTHLRHVVPLQ